MMRRHNHRYCNPAAAAARSLRLFSSSGILLTNNNDTNSSASSRIAMKRVDMTSAATAAASTSTTTTAATPPAGADPSSTHASFQHYFHSAAATTASSNTTGTASPPSSSSSSSSAEEDPTVAHYRAIRSEDVESMDPLDAALSSTARSRNNNNRGGSASGWTTTSGEEGEFDTSVLLPNNKKGSSSSSGGSGNGPSLFSYSSNTNSTNKKPPTKKKKTMDDVLGDVLSEAIALKDQEGQRPDIDSIYKRTQERLYEEEHGRKAPSSAAGKESLQKKYLPFPPVLSMHRLEPTVRLREAVTTMAASTVENANDDDSATTAAALAQLAELYLPSSSLHSINNTNISSSSGVFLMYNVIAEDVHNGEAVRQGNGPMVPAAAAAASSSSSSSLGAGAASTTTTTTNKSSSSNNNNNATTVLRDRRRAAAVVSYFTAREDPWPARAITAANPVRNRNEADAFEADRVLRREALQEDRRKQLEKLAALRTYYQEEQQQQQQQQQGQEQDVSSSSSSTTTSHVSYARQRDALLASVGSIDDQLANDPTLLSDYERMYSPKCLRVAQEQEHALGADIMTNGSGSGSGDAADSPLLSSRRRQRRAASQEAAATATSSSSSSSGLLRALVGEFSDAMDEQHYWELQFIRFIRDVPLWQRRSLPFLHEHYRIVVHRLVRAEERLIAVRDKTFAMAKADPKLFQQTEALLDRSRALCGETHRSLSSPNYDPVRMKKKSLAGRLMALSLAEFEGEWLPTDRAQRNDLIAAVVSLVGEEA